MSSLIKLYKQHIRNTKHKAIVVEVSILICNLTYAVHQALKTKSLKVHINTKVLKKLYDKRPAGEFDVLLNHLPSIAKYPENIYSNKTGRLGKYLFTKRIDEVLYICSILDEMNVIVDGKTENVNLVVTAFKNDGDYLKDCTLLWSWKGGTPSS